MQIAEKIRKLMAHEQSARSIGNLAEAETFAAKIQDLVLRHKLTMSDVELHVEPINAERADSSKAIKRKQDWSLLLARSAAEACLCDAIGQKGTNAVLFVGRGGDRKLAISIWLFLVGLARDLAATDVPKVAAMSRMHPARVRVRYLMGFALAISLRLAKEKQATVDASGETGLMRIQSEGLALKSWENTNLKLRSSSLSLPRNSAAFRAGFMRGTEAPLRKQHTLEVPRG